MRTRHPTLAASISSGPSLVWLGWLVCLWLTSPCLGQRALRPEPAGRPLAFRDVTNSSGLGPVVGGIRGHGAAWGDVDGDDWIDLYVGTFHTDGQPNLLARNQAGQFVLDPQETLRISARTTGVVFADLDNDGDLDLYVASMPAPADSRLAQRAGKPLVGCTLFRNDGDGRFTDVSPGNGACPARFGGRSAAALLDYDADGLLDLLVGEDPLTGYNGSATRSSRIFRNLGGLQFEDVSREVGLPADVPGLGVASADLNNDSWPDIFLASAEGGNRLFLNTGRGRFEEATETNAVFAWPTAGGDDMVCGVAVGDVNHDGWLDIVMGQHFDRPWAEPVAIRLFLNRGTNGAALVFEEVTDQAGLVPLPMKAPHVELQDYDNDGWLDISTSIVKFAGDQPHPVIFRHRGMREGMPQFAAPALGVNDFPTEEDRAIRRSGPFFERMLAQGNITYTAAGPSGDYDNDGRMDLFLPSWWLESRSLLLRNVTPGGHWLDVRVDGGTRINRQGIGSRVSVYVAGHLGEPAARLGCRDVSVGFGYASGQAAVAHFGLGDVQAVDVEVLLPGDQGRVVARDVQVNRRIVIEADRPR